MARRRGTRGDDHLIGGTGRDHIDGRDGNDFIDGTDDFKLNGVNAGDRTGFSLSGAGDINGDGIDDVIVCAPYASLNGDSLVGKTYVVFGKTGGFGAEFELSSLDGTNGFAIEGTARPDNFGWSVSGAGDLNNDGYDDMVIGARWSDANTGSQSGQAYILYGSAAGFAASFDAADIGNGVNGFRIDALDGGDNLGYSVSGGGDVNNDGIDDVLVTAFFAEANGSSPGVTFVIYGFETTVSEDVITLTGNVLGNDSDADGDTVSISAFDAVIANGATITAGGSLGTFNYDPTASAVLQNLGEGETLTDSFSYTISDGNGGFDTATVTVGVSGVIDADQTVNGTANDDTLFGADGNDTLFGDTGDDVFVFTDGAGDDTVTDFEAGAGTDDQLDVSDFGFADLADLLASTNDAGADTVITLDGDDSLTLIGVSKADLQEDDFLF
jgi:hypothetical protein